MKNFFVRLIKKLLASISIGEKNSDGIVHFICGGEALPQPLAKDDEAYCIATLADGNEESRAKLIEHNLRLVVYIAKRFENTGVDMEDLISVGTIGLIKAVNSFKADKNIKLATYASRCIENEILMHLRKTVKQKAEVSLEEPLNSDFEGNMLLLGDVLGTDGDVVYKDIETGVERDVLMQTFDKLQGRERMIVEMRYGLKGREEKTQKEIADMMGISQSYISRLEMKILQRMRKEMSKLV